MVAGISATLGALRKCLEIVDTSDGWNDGDHYDLKDFYQDHLITVGEDTYAYGGVILELSYLDLDGLNPVNKKFLLTGKTDLSDDYEECYLFGTENNPITSADLLKFRLVYDGANYYLKHKDDVDLDDYATLPEGTYDLTYSVSNIYDGSSEAYATVELGAPLAGIVPSVAVEFLSNRKVLTIVDASTGLDDFIEEFYQDNADGNYVKLSMAIHTKTKMYEIKTVLTSGADYVPDDDEVVEPMFGTAANPVTDVADLRFPFLLSPTGELIILNDLTDIEYMDYLPIPDGICKVKYEINDVEYFSEFVITSGAEQVVEDCANKIADSILTCQDTNVDQISDYLVYEGLLYAANKAAFISRSNRIVNILHVLNND